MKVQLHAQGLWDVVEDSPGDYREDQLAMLVLLWVVPPELVRTFGVKKTAKEAWDTLKSSRLELSVSEKPGRRHDERGGVVHHSTYGNRQ